MKRISGIFAMLLLFSSWSYAKIPSKTQGVEEQSTSSEYRVGVEDVLEINVSRPEKMSQTATVGPDGAITFPLIGNVPVKGMTLNGIQQEVRARLADGYMKYPDVSVSLKESRSKKFFISGEVVKPGAYPMDDNTTLLKAVSIAGGFSTYGSSGWGKVMRPRKNGQGYESIPINVKAIMEGKQPNVVIQPGDTITLTEDKFFVQGEVSKPGSYPIEENTTLIKAVSMAGGFTKSGSSGRVKVLRPAKTGSGYETINVNIKGMMDQSSEEANMQLQPGDTVVVAEDKFFVYGAVSKPGPYPIEENTTVLKAISMVGGFSKFGSSSKVKILRPKKSGVGYETIKVNIKGIMDGSSKEADVVIQPGDTVVVSEGIF